MLQSCLANRPRRRWRIWLGGRRCGLHLCEPILGLRSIEEAEAALGASLSLEGRAVAVRLATWSSTPRPWLALTTEAGLIERLMATLEDGEGRVHSVRPWWTMLSGGEAAGAAMCDEEAITYWRVDKRGVVSSAATTWVTQDQQAAALQRLRVSGELPAWRLSLTAADNGAAGIETTRIGERADVAA